MDEDYYPDYFEFDESCNVRQSTSQNEMETQSTVQGKQNINQNYAKKDKVSKTIKQILYSTRYCSLCMETGGALVLIHRHLKIYGICGNRRDEISLKEVLSKIFHDISDLLVTSYVCKSCVDEAVRAYTFIYNSKRSVKIISDYVTEFHSKLAVLEDKINPNNEAKYLIVIEPHMSELNEYVNEFSDNISEVSEDITEVIGEKAKKVFGNLTPKKLEELTKVTCPTLILDGTNNILEIRHDEVPIIKMSVTKEPKEPLKQKGVNKKTKGLKTSSVAKKTRQTVIKEDENNKANGSLKCKICFKTSPTQKKLIAHYQNHKRTKCRICHMFVLNSQLQLHLKFHHQDYLYPCDYCNFVYYAESDLAKHVKTHWHEYEDDVEDLYDQCVMCLNFFSEATVLNHSCEYKCPECNSQPCLHEKYLMDYRESRCNIIKCPDCDHVCGGKYNLIEHANREHLDLHQHVCDICGLEYYSETMLDAHKQNSHSQDTVCVYCDQVFEDPSEFAKHSIELCRSDYRKLKCSECKASFDTSDMLTQHKDFRHKDFPSFKPVNSDNIILKSNPNKSGKRIVNKYFQCPICNIEFGLNADFMQHVMKIHGPNYICKDCNLNFDEPKSFLLHYDQQHLQKIICELCDKSFATQSKLNVHKKYNHIEPVECHICNKMMKPASLKTHMNWHKEQENPSLKKPAAPKFYKCDTCGQLTSSKTMLTGHINRYHLKVKPFKCTVCDVAYSLECQLKEHMVAHSEEKWHECNICNKKLLRRTGFKRHMMLHTGERPFICKICGKGWVCIGSLKEHIKTHSGKKLKCPLCSRRYYVVKALRQHIKRRHWDNKDKPFDRRLVEGLTEEHDYIFQDGRNKL